MFKIKAEIYDFGLNQLEFFNKFIPLDKPFYNKTFNFHNFNNELFFTIENYVLKINWKICFTPSNILILHLSEGKFTEVKYNFNKI